MFLKKDYPKKSNPLRLVIVRMVLLEKTILNRDGASMHYDKYRRQHIRLCLLS